MSNEEMKAKLHEYVDKASEEELQELLCMFEEDATYTTNADSIWEDPEFVREMERRAEEIENGEVEGIPWEQVHSEIRARLAEGAVKDGK